MEFTPDLPALERMAAQVRRDIIRMVYDAQSGHPGGSLGCVEYLLALYQGVMRHYPEAFSIRGVEEDMFFLSNGHISPVYYSVLARSGYFPVEELATFRKIDSRLQGHPAVKEKLPGVRVATGSLGQGFSVAVGAALAKKLDKDHSLVFALLGDGETQEGQVWEAANFAAHHKVDNLIAAVDLNYKQIDGDTRKVMNTESLAKKFEAFNWKVLEEPEGNDFAAIFYTLERALTLLDAGKPVVILLRTVMGKGVDYMEDDYNWHGKAPDKEGYERALAQLPETIGDY